MTFYYPLLCLLSCLTTILLLFWLLERRPDSPVLPLAGLCRLRARHCQPYYPYNIRGSCCYKSFDQGCSYYYLILSCALLPCLVMSNAGASRHHSSALQRQTTASLPQIYPQTQKQGDKRTELKHYGDFTLFTYRRLCRSLLDRLSVSLGIPFPAIISFSMGRFPPDAATLLSRYPGIVSDLRPGLPEHRLLRPGLHRPRQLHFGM